MRHDAPNFIWINDRLDTQLGALNSETNRSLAVAVLCGFFQNFFADHAVSNEASKIRSSSIRIGEPPCPASNRIALILFIVISFGFASGGEEDRPDG